MANAIDHPSAMVFDTLGWHGPMPYSHVTFQD